MHTAFCWGNRRGMGRLELTSCADFWGPASNFGIPVAAVMDIQKDPEMYVLETVLSISFTPRLVEGLPGFSPSKRGPCQLNSVSLHNDPVARCSLSSPHTYLSQW
jgi:Mitochondrial pyruvate carriers